MTEYAPFDPRIRRIPGTLSLVLPAHNEQDNIEPVVRLALEVLPHLVEVFEVIVVDDGSKDHTADIAGIIAQDDPRVRLIRHPRNRGYGGAVTTGIDASTGEFVMFMDSDRQFDIADLQLLSPFFGEYDVVAGFRLERNDPLHRRVFAEIFNVGVRLLFGVHLRDIDCAFKVFRGDQVRGLELSSPGALINTEMQAKLRRQGATLMQVGVHHYPRIAGEATGGNPRVILRAAKETLALWWRMHFYVPPKASPAPCGPYLLGDAIVIGGLALGLSAISAAWQVMRRWPRR
ncbi:MAG: glycosyltransferase family 2 protein [Chloroflexota bacterium]